jgi:hypothetical protein
MSTNGLQLTPSPHQDLHLRHKSNPTTSHAATITKHLITWPTQSQILLTAISNTTQHNTTQHTTDDFPRTYGFGRGMSRTFPDAIEAQLHPNLGIANLSSHTQRTSCTPHPRTRVTNSSHHPTRSSWVWGVALQCWINLLHNLLM